MPAPANPFDTLVALFQEAVAASTAAPGELSDGAVARGIAPWRPASHAAYAFAASRGITFAEANGIIEPAGRAVAGLWLVAVTGKTDYMPHPTQGEVSTTEAMFRLESFASYLAGRPGATNQAETPKADPATKTPEEWGAHAAALLIRHKDLIRRPGTLLEFMKADGYPHSRQAMYKLPLVKAAMAAAGIYTPRGKNPGGLAWGIGRAAGSRPWTIDRPLSRWQLGDTFRRVGFFFRPRVNDLRRRAPGIR